ISPAGHRRRQLGATRFGKIDEGRHGGTLAAVGAVGIAVVLRPVLAERRQRRGHRRERVGFVVQAGNQDFHAQAPRQGRACDSTRYRLRSGAGEALIRCLTPYGSQTPGITWRRASLDAWLYLAPAINWRRAWSTARPVSRATAPAVR